MRFIPLGFRIDLSIFTDRKYFMKLYDRKSNSVNIETKKKYKH